MSEWREYWTAKEYAEMQDVLSPEELREELDCRRAKQEHYRIALEEFGFALDEAALMRVRSMMALGAAGRAAS